MNGQIVLKGKRYLTVRDGVEKARSLVTDAEVDEARENLLLGRLT